MRSVREQQHAAQRLARGQVHPEPARAAAAAQDAVERRPEAGANPIQRPARIAGVSAWLALGCLMLEAEDLFADLRPVGAVQFGEPVEGFVGHDAGLKLAHAKAQRRKESRISLRLCVRLFKPAASRRSTPSW